jgi:hypothetical protein
LQDHVCEIKTLQDWMGHKDLASTLVYLKAVRNKDVMLDLNSSELAALAIWMPVRWSLFKLLRQIKAHRSWVDELVAGGMWSLDALEVTLPVKGYEAITGRGLLDPKLSGQFSRGYGSPATENETQGLSVASGKSTSRLRLSEVSGWRADKNREVLGSGDVADHTSRGPIFAAYDKGKISVSSRTVVFTNRNDDIPEDAGGGPQRAQMQDSNWATPRS